MGEVGVYTVEQLMKLADRLGVHTEVSVEGFGANLEENLLRIVRSTNGFLDKIDGNAARAGELPATTGSKLQLWEL